ncbi:MAG: hypothetical protein AAF614_05960 [Chloroflexota bacterium]
MRDRISKLGRGLRRFWQFLGRMGLALRNLLTWFIWWPIYYLFLPVRWLWQTVLSPLLRWTIRQAAKPFQALWQATSPRRTRWRRRWQSRWLVRKARLRLFFRRPKPPKTAVLAPNIPQPQTTSRPLIVATLLATATFVGMAGYLVQQQQPTQTLSQPSLQLPRTIVLTPTPLPATAVPTLAPPTTTPEPTLPALRDPLENGGSVVFSLNRDGNEDIYLLPVGQAAPIRLTYHPAPDRDPIWRPDGTEVAFSSRRDGNWEIYVYNLADDGLRRITNQVGFDGAPSWSPDGAWLLYESYIDENLDIYFQESTGNGDAVRLTEHPAADFAPVWAPDGRHVAFTSWRSGNQDLFLLSLDDATRDETAVNLTLSPDAHEDEAAFAPNGRFLAYTLHNATAPLVMARPFSQDNRLVNTPISIGQQGHTPTWSPDSSSLLYIHERSGRELLLGSSLDAWGIAPQAYVPNGRLSHPSWSPTIVPPEVLANLQARLARRTESTTAAKELFTEALAPGPLSLLFEIPVNAPSPYLSDRIDQSFLALRERVIAEAGWDFLGQLDGLFEPLDSQPLPGESGKNWNKAGRAFDVTYREALAFDPQIEVLREDVGTETYWRVFVKTAVQDGSQGRPLRQPTWDFRARFGEEPRYYDAGGKLRDTIPAGYYIDFTALAADYGWQRVAAAPNWRTYFPSIQFWHFENNADISWGEAMRQLYSEEVLIEAFGANWDQ